MVRIPARNVSALRKLEYMSPPVRIPPIPPMGWGKVSEQNFESLKLPKIPSGVCIHYYFHKNDY